MLSISYVDDYLNRFKSGGLIFNEKRIQMVKWLERDILPYEDLYYFDEEQIENYFQFSRTWFFELDDWEKFISSFVFLYEKKKKRPLFKTFVVVISRGAGKTGWESSLGSYFISSAHGVEDYDVAFIANSNEQAQRPFLDVFNVIKREPSLAAIRTRDTTFEEEPLGEFEPYKSRITSIETNSTLKFYTSNPDTKDGGRDGALFFDEFHQFEDSELVKVFTGGQGKVTHPRVFFIGTKGYVRDGYFDLQYRRAEEILKGERPHRRMFPFICELDDISEMDDFDLWEKANPALQKPLTDRAELLLETMVDEYEELNDDPSGRTAFVTKRMNFIDGNQEHSVATEDEIMATNRPFFDVDGLVPIGSLDYGSVRDFAACGLLFKKGEEYAFKSESFVIKNFVDAHYGYSNKANAVGGGKKAPIREWEEKGLLSVIDEPSLDPRHIVNWFIDARSKYGVQKIIADNYKMDILRPLLEEAGFEVEVIKRPQSIHPLLAPRVEDGFANKRFIFGDNPLMRWYTRNVFVRYTSSGKVFDKKEETKRKTDGFQAFVHALYRANELDDQQASRHSLDLLSKLNF